MQSLRLNDMSKLKLKKMLESLDKEEIIEAVLEMYASRKEAKAYWDYFVEPDCTKMLEKAKKGVRGVFYTRGEDGHARRRPRFKEGNKIVADFKLLPPDEESLAELLTYYCEQCINYLLDSYRVYDSTLGSASILWHKTIEQLESPTLPASFMRRLEISKNKLKDKRPRYFKSVIH